jgi:hypothetical protein
LIPKSRLGFEKHLDKLLNHSAKVPGLKGLVLFAKTRPYKSDEI